MSCACCTQLNAVERTSVCSGLQERSWLRPLLLAVTSGAQRLAWHLGTLRETKVQHCMLSCEALRLQKMLWRSLAVLTDPEAKIHATFNKSVLRSLNFDLSRACFLQRIDACGRPYWSRSGLIWPSVNARRWLGDGRLRMFLEAQEMMGQGAEFHLLPTVRKDQKMAGFPSSSADVQSWVVQEECSHAP